MHFLSLIVRFFFVRDYNNVPLRRVIDGDAIVIDLPCADSLVCKKLPVRIYGLDTPKKRARCEREQRLALQAKADLEAFLTKKQIGLRNCKRETSTALSAT